MPNHYHFIIEQKTEIPITKVIVKICTSYSKYFNKKYSSVGHLFQDKFKSVLIESNEQLRLVFDYIHNNPKEAGLVNNISDWKWSSYSKVPEFTMSDIVIL
jgi:REP element-mobilizing transposase RayT